MDDFSDIAPYPDHELVGRLHGLTQNANLLDTIARFQFPVASKLLKPICRTLLRRKFDQELSTIENREDWHRVLARYVQKLIETTSDGFSFTGIENLPVDEASLFISNHRDITLDPILVNYALWQNNLPRTQIAIGDNLLEMSFEAEFMRLNDSFIVVRKAKGLREQYKAMTKTSKYIRHTLEKGQSIWIAQREGRSKDGLDRTDPAVLKMLGLAYRDESSEISHLLDQINLVPTTFTYELDPCAPLKAREMASREKTGTYEKAENEDRDSLIEGIRGFKGHIHLAFGKPVKGNYRDADELANVIDHIMAASRTHFETFQLADARMSGTPEPELSSPRVKAALEQQLALVSGREEDLLLAQYANQLRR